MSAVPNDARDDARTSRRVLLAVLALVALVYVPVLSAGFVVDDVFLAKAEREPGVRNPMVAELRPLGEYFTSHYWRGTLVGDPLYRPLPILSYALVGTTLGRVIGEAPAQHLVNVVLHVAATALAFALLRRLRVSPLAAGVGAAVFGLHALRHEAVAMVVGRAELLAFACGAAAVLAFVRMRDAQSAGARVGAGVTSGTALLAAFLAKESALAFVALVPLFEIARRLVVAAPIVRELPRLVATTAAVVAPTVVVWWWLRASMLEGLPDTGTIAWLSNPLAHEAAGPRFRTATVVLAWSLLRTLIPFQLVHDHGPLTFAIQSSPFGVGYLASGTVLLVLLIGGLWSARRHPLLLLAATSFLGFAFVTSNLPFAIGTVYGERLSYTPALGLTFAVAWLVQRVEPTRRRRIVLVAVAAWCLWSVVQVVPRHADYRDEPTLVAVDAQRNPASLRMQIVMAGRDGQAGDVAGAIRRLERVVASAPDLALAWNALGEQQLAAGRLDEAEQSLRRGLVAKHRQPREDGFRLHGNLGTVLKLQRRLPEAFESLQISNQLAPQHLPTIVELIDVALSGNQPDAPIEHFLAQGEAIAPGNPEWRFFRGLLAQRRGDLAAAERELRAALDRTSPQLGGFARVVESLVRVQIARGKRTEAITALERMTADPRLPPETRERLRRVLDGVRGG